MLTRHSPLHVFGPCGSGVVSGESQFSGRLGSFEFQSQDESRASTKKVRGPIPSHLEVREDAAVRTVILDRWVPHRPPPSPDAGDSGSQVRETSKPVRKRVPSCPGPAAGGVASCRWYAISTEIPRKIFLTGTEFAGCRGWIDGMAGRSATIAFAGDFNAIGDRD